MTAVMIRGFCPCCGRNCSLTQLQILSWQTSALWLCSSAACWVCALQQLFVMCDAFSNCLYMGGYRSGVVRRCLKY